MKNVRMILSVLVLTALFSPIQAQLYINQLHLINEFDSPDFGPITGLAFRNGSLYAVSAGTNTLYRMNDETGVINDAWAVPVPDGYEITGLGCDEGYMTTLIGLHSTSPDSCEKILFYYAGEFTPFDVPSEIDYLSGLALSWYTAGYGYIGTYNQLWSFEAWNTSIDDFTFCFNYPSPTDLPRDIACENVGTPEGNMWIANFSSDYECLATIVNCDGMYLGDLERDDGITEVYGITCQPHSGSVDYDYDLFVSTDTNKIFMYSYEINAGATLEQSTWASIKTSF